MTGLLTTARRAAFAVPDRRIRALMGGDSPEWQHLLTAVRADICGYNAVVDGGSLDDIVARIDEVPAALSGYAHEGIAMGLTAFDLLLPRKSRFRRFLAGPGHAHAYMAHIGAGQALALFRRRPEPYLARLDDQVLSWLVVEGYGFHLGFFSRAKYQDQQVIPGFLSPFARRMFDQGLGRAIWFSSGADIDSIAAHVAAFTPARHADLWVGVGLACCYVGGQPRERIEHLRDLAGPNVVYAATGAAFAARGRHRVGHPQPGTELACEVLCGTDSVGASQLVEGAFASVPAKMTRPGYEYLLTYMFDALTQSDRSMKEDADDSLSVRS